MINEIVISALISTTQSPITVPEAPPTPKIPYENVSAVLPDTSYLKREVKIIYKKD